MVTTKRSRFRLRPGWLIGAAAVCGCSFELPAVGEHRAGAGAPGGGAAPGAGGSGAGVGDGGVAGAAGGGVGGVGTGGSGAFPSDCTPPPVSACTQNTGPTIVVPGQCPSCYRPILAANPTSKDGWVGMVVGESGSAGKFVVIDRFGNNLINRPGTFAYQASSQMIAAASGRFALASNADLWLVDRCGNDVWHHALPPQSGATGDWEVALSAFGDDVWLSLTLNLTELNVGRLDAGAPEAPVLSPISKVTCCNGRAWSLAARANGHAEMAYHGPGPMQEPPSMRALALVDLSGSTAADSHSELGGGAPRFSAVLTSPPRLVVVTGSSVLVGVREGSSYTWQPPLPIEPFDVDPKGSSSICGFAASESRVWRACKVDDAISVREINLDPNGQTELELANLKFPTARTGPALAWDGQGLAVAWHDMGGVAYAHLCAP